jgi:energy-coupling factor transporter transmembrane protein EcfT
MQNPASLFEPDFSAGYFAQRILAVLFWFVISLILTTILPGTVSRAITRLKLNSLRVAVIGGLAGLIGTFGAGIGLSFFPTPIGVMVTLLLTTLLFTVYVFGRVAVQAASGKHLQKLIFGEENRSESVALLLGAILWTIILSLPFIWTLAFIGLLIISLGVVLTTRPAFNRK